MTELHKRKRVEEQASEWDSLVRLEELHVPAALVLGRSCYLSDGQIFQWSRLANNQVIDSKGCHDPLPYLDRPIRDLFPIYTHHLVCRFNKKWMGILLRGKWTFFYIDKDLRVVRCDLDPFVTKPVGAVVIQDIWVQVRVEWIALFRPGALLFVPADPTQWSSSPMQVTIWQIPASINPFPGKNHLFLFSSKDGGVVVTVRSDDLYKEYVQACGVSRSPFLEMSLASGVVKLILAPGGGVMERYYHMRPVDPYHFMAPGGVFCLHSGTIKPVQGWETDQKFLPNNWVYAGRSTLMRYHLTCLTGLSCTRGGPCSWSYKLEPIFRLSPGYYFSGVNDVSCAEDWILIGRFERSRGEEERMVPIPLRCTHRGLATDEFLARTWFELDALWMSTSLRLPVVLVQLIRRYCYLDEPMLLYNDK
jgi:hypothetical protein